MTHSLRLPVVQRVSSSAATSVHNSPLSGAIGLASSRAPTYLRAIVTARCPLSCPFCHREGDVASSATVGGLPREQLVALISAGVLVGMRKIKLLGGDPLARPDLAAVVAGVRAVDADVDISVITAGVFAVSRLDELFAAGLSRCNVSIHGWSEAALATRGGNAKQHAMRTRFLEAVLKHGRPLKLNYVVSSDDNPDDLDSLLSWAAGRPLVVNTLDNLNENDGADGVYDRLVQLRGTPTHVWEDPDPHSLPTLHLRWADGLEVEIKHQQLGKVAPWHACNGCTKRASCREGIHAVRLTHRGVLRPCMDRDDLGLDLMPILETHGVDGVVSAWRNALGSPMEQAA